MDNSGVIGRWRDTVLRAERRLDRRIEKLAREPYSQEGLSVPRRLGGGSRRSVTALVFVLLVGGGLFAAEEQDKGPDTSRAFKFLETQDSSSDPVTYDPCVPIYLLVDTRTMVDDGMRLLDEAADEVADATGLTFVVYDRTIEPQQRARPAAPPEGAWAPVVVSWTDPASYKRLKGDVEGSAASESSMHGGRRWFVIGDVHLDGPQLAKTMERRHGPKLVRAVIMHELGHLVGLDHVNAPGQVMQPSLHDDVTTWGDGDRAGLAALGRPSCADD